MISPSSFTAVLTGDIASRNVMQQNSYIAKVLKKLKPLYAITASQIGYIYNSDLAGLDTIKQELDNKEFGSIIIKPLKEIRLITLVRNPQETTPFKLFVENMRNDYNPGYSGVIFPVMHGGDFIIHNLGSPFERSFDHAKIVMQSRDSSLNDLTIEPLDNFITERRRTDI